MSKLPHYVFYIILYFATVGTALTISTISGLARRSTLQRNLPQLYQNLNCNNCSTVNIVEGNSPDDITFITVPRAHINNDQRNKYTLVVSSWLSSSPKSKVILYAPEDEFDTTGQFQKRIIELFGENRVFYKGYLKSDQDGVPYVDDWFRRGVDDATTKFVCFINTDILLSADWLRRVKQVYKAFKENESLVLINQRIDFDLYKSIDQMELNATDFLEQIDRLVKSSSHETHSFLGMDTFTFKKDPLPFNVDLIPPFIVGRYNWDNWLVGYLNAFTTTVSFNIDPPIYHINHRRHDFDPNDPRVAANSNLRLLNRGYFGSNMDTSYNVHDGILLSKFGKRIILPRDIE